MICGMKCLAFATQHLQLSSIVTDLRQDALANVVFDLRCPSWQDAHIDVHKPTLFASLAVGKKCTRSEKAQRVSFVCSSITAPCETSCKSMLRTSSCPTWKRFLSITLVLQFSTTVAAAFASTGCRSIISWRQSTRARRFDEYSMRMCGMV